MKKYIKILLVLIVLFVAIPINTTATEPINWYNGTLSNVNLNTVTDSGLYIGYNTCTNAPLLDTFFLRVSSYNKRFVIQEYTSFHDTSKRYYRFFDTVSGRYDEWINANNQNLTSEPSSPLKEEVIVAFGDSITGNYNYPQLVADKTGTTVYNVGFGGTRMGMHSQTTTDGYKYQEFSMYRLADEIVKPMEDLSRYEKQELYADELNFRINLNTIKTIDFNKVDTIIIFYGANDYSGNNPVDNESDPFDVATFGGALRYSLDKIWTAYPHLQVLLVTPTWRSRITDGDKKDADNYTNSQGNFVIDYVKKEIEIAEKFKTPVYDAYHNLGINKYTESLYLRDGLHLSDKGLKIFANKISGKLISEFDSQ